MAIYTHVGQAELDALLARYDLGAATAFKGIAEGVENSNYFLSTQKSRFILTLYEKRVRQEDLGFFLGLMEHLSQKGLPVPIPIHDREGKVEQNVAGRPAAIISFLEGVSAEQITVSHCEAVGAALAKLHLAGQDFSQHRANDLGPKGWRELADQHSRAADSVVAGLSHLIDQQMAELERRWPFDLPSGVIHADLFTDNVLFLGNKLSGIIDFYFACNDAFAYDIAVCLNDWCFSSPQRYDTARGNALITGYVGQRPLGEAERHYLPLLAQGAAMRFLLTRLHDWLTPTEGAIVQPKDPRAYAERVKVWRDADTAMFAS